MTGEPRSVLVVGGGTAGWLTASYLAVTVGKSRGINVTLVESPDIGVIGVGEATIPTLRRTIADLGISEEEFLKGSNGAFKQAIRFQNWTTDPVLGENHFYHPFHRGSEADVQAAMQHQLSLPGHSPEAFARMATPQTLACDANKAPRKIGSAEKGLAYAYHMDAILFGRFLRKRFEGAGVRRIEGEIRNVERLENGGIDCVVLANGERLQADLYVDCSGFRGLLINQSMGIQFRSFTDWLPCDKALAISVPYREGERIRPYTVSTAQKSGWIWDINLASRRGVGHVYSSAHMTADEAEQGLRAYLGASWPQDAIVRPISMRIGRNEQLWAHNCVAIGLAGGFIEPLESTGIYLVEQGVRYLVDYWPVNGQSDAARWGYTRLMHDAYDEVIQFVLMHYVTSQRRDSAFWRDITVQRELPGDLDRMLAAWRCKLPSSYDVRTMSGNVFGHESYMAILSGMGWLKGVSSPYVGADRAGVGHYISGRLSDFERQVADLPSHEDYLAAIGAGGRCESAIR